MTSNLINISLSADTGRLVRGLAVATAGVNAFQKGLSTTQGLARQVTSTFQNMDRAVRLAGAGLVATAGGMALSLRKTAQEAANFEARMNNVATIVSRADLSMMKANERILQMSRTLPQTANELAEGLYDLASSGVPAAQQMDVLNASAKAASAGLSTTEVSARAIAAAMNAYGVSAGTANQISDVFFATVNAGVLTFEELAVNMGDWIGVASNLGVSLDDAASALATITLSGIPAAQAATNLSRVMTGLIEPSDSLKEVFAELGVTTGTQLISQFGGVAGALEAIQSVAGESIEATTGLFNNINAVEGVLALTAREGENFARVEAIMADAAGATNRALQEQAQGFEYSMQIMRNTATAARIEFGQYLLPVLGWVVEGITSFLNAVTALPGPVKGLIAGAAGLSTVLTALAGVVLLTSLRKRLYRLALDQLPASLLKTRMGTAAQTVAQQGLTGATVRAIPSFTQWLALQTSAVPRLGATTAAINMQAQRVSMLATDVGKFAKGLGLAAVGVTLWMDMAGATATARAEAEAYVDTIQQGLDFTTYETAIDSVNALIESYNRFNEEVIDSYGVMDAFGQAVLRVTPFVASSMERNLAVQEEYEDEINNTTAAIQQYEAVVERLAFHLGIGEQQARAFLDAADPQAFQRLIDQVMMLGADNPDVEYLFIPIVDSLRTLYPEWLRNGGAAGDFSDQLAAMEDPILAAAGATEELTERQKDWLQAIQAIAAADFGEQLSDKRDTIQEFADILEESGRGAAVAFAEDMRNMGVITEETFQTLKNNGDVGAEAWRAISESASLGINDYIAALTEANTRLIQWQQDMITVGDRAGAGFQEVVTSYLNSLGDDAPEMAAAMASATDEEFMRMVDAIKTNVENSGEQAAVEMDAAMQIIESAARRGGTATAQAIADELEVGVGAVRAIANEYGVALAGGINPVLVALGRNQIFVRNPALNRPARGAFATGGRVDGQGDGDTVPAMLTPGEFVIRKKAAQAIGLHRLHRLNRADQQQVQFYAEGGQVGFQSIHDVPPTPDVSGEPFGYFLDVQVESALDAVRNQVMTFMRENSWLLGAATGSTTGLDPKFLSRFNAYNAALGGILRIISGFRSRAQQAHLYGRYMAGVPGQAPAAPPGKSKHEKGLAIDHAPHSNAGMRARAAGFRLWYPMSYEPWHVEPVETRSFDKGGLLQPGYTLAYNGTGRPELVAKMANGGEALASGHATVNWQNVMVGNLSGTRVGQHILAANKDNPEQARRDLERLLELYVEISDRLGQATADEMVFYNTGLEGLNALAEATLAAADAADELAAEHMRINDVRFEIGEIGTDRYLEILNQRLAATEKYSEEWLQIWNQINEITEQAAEHERELLGERLDTLREQLDAAESELEDHISNFESAYSNAQDAFASQQEAYNSAIAERARRIQEEIGRFRDGLVDSFRDLTNPLTIFQGDRNVTAAEVTAALRHRVRATQKFADVYKQLVAKGFSEEVLTDLAQQGPQALSLATALLKIDPALVNEAMASTSQIGGGIADIALSWERAKIEEEVYHSVTLPNMRSFNDLLQEELELMAEREAREAEARAWAKEMAGQVYPALTAQVTALRLEYERLNAAMATGGGGAASGPANWGSSPNETPAQRAARIASQVSGGIRTFDQVRASLGLPTGVAGAGVDASILAQGPAAVQARIEQMLRNAGQFDNGGWLPPGYSVAYNGTGFPERVGGPVVEITVMPGAVTLSAGMDSIGSTTVEGVLRQGLQDLKRDILRKVRV